MKKIFAFTIAALSLLVVSCNKEMVPESIVTIEKSFTVTAPEGTKTALSGMDILWTAGDEINVIAKTSGNEYTFTLSSGEGQASAKFSGTIAASDEGDEFYAVYPNVSIRPAVLSAATPLIEFNKSMGRKRIAVKDGFDPAQSVLTAVADSDGNFAFRHGSAYFKIQITQENVDSIVITTSNARFSGRPQYNLDGSYSNIQNGDANVTLAPESGVLESGATYYIPVLCKNSNLKTLTLKAYRHDGKISSVSTDKKSSVKLELGKVYDLGAPNITFDPIITLVKNLVDGLSADAATGITSVDAYTLRNCVDDDVTVTYDGTVVTAASVADGTVTFNISANTGDTREGWIGLAVPGGEVQKITVKQLSAGAKEHYLWDFSDSGWDTAFENASTAKGSNQSGWNVSHDGLTYTSGSKNGKWDVDATYGRFIQPNGSGSKTERVFTFTTNTDGALKIAVLNPTKSSTRNVVVVDGSNTSQSKGITNPSDQVIYDVLEFSVKAGNFYVYPDAGLRFFKFEFTEN